MQSMTVDLNWHSVRNAVVSTVLFFSNTNLWHSHNPTQPSCPPVTDENKVTFSQHGDVSWLISGRIEEGRSEEVIYMQNTGIILVNLLFILLEN